MTDNEIIKALECHAYTGIETCELCPLLNVEGCAYKLAQSSLDLINRQKAEIKALQMDNKQLETDNFNANMNCEHLQAEIERFEECASREMLYEKAKAEAVKEFAERLKGKLHINGVVMGSNCAIVSDADIDNLVKEMVGAESGI